MAPQQSLAVNLFWDTFAQPGTHMLIAVVDPDNAVVELSELDNQAQIEVDVLAASTTAELEIRATDSRYRQRWRYPW